MSSENGTVTGMKKDILDQTRQSKGCESHAGRENIIIDVRG